MILFSDTETFCEVPIRNGTFIYAASAEIMLVQYAVDDGPVTVRDLTAGDDLDEFKRLAEEADIVVFHKSDFDRTVLRHNGIVIPPEKIHCTMVQALSHGLPGGLDKLCGIFGVPMDQAKDKRGKALVQLFCKPRPKNSALRRATKHTYPAEWKIFVEDYAPMDVVAMRAIYKKMPRWNYPAAREHALWVLDQKINDRGFAVDQELARAAIAAVDATKKNMDAATGDLTFGEVHSTTQRDRLLKHLLAEWGVELPDMQKSTLERRLADEELPWPVRELIAIRLQVSTTSNAKYNSLLKAVSADGRLRGTMQFCGAARTKRWAGRTWQPQNLPRPDMEAWDIEVGIDTMKAGPSAVRLLYDEPMKLASNAIRGCIVAAEGRKLVVSDLEQVEARTLPWLAGEQWELDAFAAYDRGEGFDNYRVNAGHILGKHPGDVTKDERQAYGKVVVLSCLGPHTQVLTDTGVKAITEVTLTDRLWDGEEWVNHQGLVNRGRRSTIRVDGVELTTDHEMLSESGWLPAKAVASSANILRSCLARGSANLPLLAMSADLKTGCAPWWCAAPVARHPTPLRRGTCDEVPPHDAMFARNARPVFPTKSGASTLRSSPMIATAAGFAGACRPPLRAVTAPRTSTMLIMAGGAFVSGRNGEKIEASFSRIWSRLRAGTIPCWRWIAKIATEATSLAMFGSSLARKTCSTDEAFLKCSDESMHWSSVYDIAHAGPRQRFSVISDSGVLIVHNCGYGGSVGAFAQFAKIYGVELPEHEIFQIVRDWRALHPALCDWDTGFWKQLDDAARQAIRAPGKTFEAGRHIRFERWREWLRMELPSGGFLSYAAPAIMEDPRRPGNQTVSYMGVNNYTRKWERLYTYGGKLSADATQSTAREIMAHNLPAIEADGFPILLLVHDEVVTEPPDDPAYSVDRLNALLAANPPWAKGLPLAAGGFEAYRYRKDG